MTLTGNPTLADPDFDNPPSNPLFMLREWLEIAGKLGVVEPNGMILSTVDTLNRPSSRVVILKSCDDSGIVFATSEDSAKGKDLKTNPWACGTLWWRETVQQINFQGQATPLSNSISDDIFQDRTREAQAVAAVSRQSAPLTNTENLRNKILNLVNSKNKIERPDGWRAYHLLLTSIEFWHGSKDRLHKRLRYDLVSGVWHYQKLQP